MLDPVSLAVAIGGVLIALITHIKHSSCYGFKMNTRTPQITPPQTPQTPINSHETTALLKSEPIKINNIPQRGTFEKLKY